MENIVYYSQFEKMIETSLIDYGKEKNFIGEHLFDVEELDEKWIEMAPEYMVDAVPEIPKYPMVAIAWAAYLGMGMAALWDGDWEFYMNKKDLYKMFVSQRGFDEMDEYICEEFLGLKKDSQEYKDLVNFYQDLAEKALTIIRKENIEPQSVDAFHIFARTEKIMYKIGVSVALKFLGYKYEKMTMPEA